MKTLLVFVLSLSTAQATDRCSLDNLKGNYLESLVQAEPGPRQFDYYIAFILATDNRPSIRIATEREITDADGISREIDLAVFLTPEGVCMLTLHPATYSCNSVTRLVVTAYGKDGRIQSAKGWLLVKNAPNVPGWLVTHHVTLQQLPH